MFCKIQEIGRRGADGVGWPFFEIEHIKGLSQCAIFFGSRGHWSCTSDERCSGCVWPVLIARMLCKAWTASEVAILEDYATLKRHKPCTHVKVFAPRVIRLILSSTPDHKQPWHSRVTFQVGRPSSPTTLVLFRQLEQGSPAPSAPTRLASCNATVGSSD